MPQQIQSSNEPSHANFLEKTVKLLLCTSAVNLCIVYLVQGGYEFSIGGIAIHARHLRNSLLLCVALAIANGYLHGKRAGANLSESLRSPILLFLVTILIYSLNDITLWSGDTIAARFLPLSLVREFDFDLDEYTFLYEPKVPYFLKVHDGHVISIYPPWVSVLALPVYVGPAILGIDATSYLMEDLEKRAAMLITAVSVVVLYFALRRVTLPKNAWFISAV